jgi:hypothetical protein
MEGKEESRERREKRKKEKSYPPPPHFHPRDSHLSPRQMTEKEETKSQDVSVSTHAINEKKNEVPKQKLRQPRETIWEMFRAGMVQMGRIGAHGGVSNLENARARANSGVAINNLDGGMVRHTMQILREDILWNTCMRNLWNSVCPDDIDMIVSIGTRRRKPLQWFSCRYINGLWKDALHKMMLSLQAVGYCCVVYAPDPANREIVVPTVLEPEDYTLWWATDRYGTVTYYADLTLNIPGARGEGAPGTSRTEISGGTLVRSNVPGESEHIPSDVFVMAGHEPNKDGLCSIGAVALEKIYQLNQLNDNIVRKIESSSVVSLVTQAGGGWRDSEAIATSAYKNAISSRPLAYPAGPYGMVHDAVDEAGIEFPIKPPAQSQRSTAENTLGLQLFGIGAVRGAQQAADEQLNQQARDTARRRAVLHTYVKYDRHLRQSHLVNVPMLFDNAPYDLPSGRALADVHLPTVEKSEIEHRNHLTAMIMLDFETAPETVLGTSSARVSTATAIQEMIRASVLHWRSTLENYATEMWWRAFGDVTLATVVEAAWRSGMVVEPRSVRDTLYDTAVEFTIRDSRITLTQAVALNQDLYVTRGTVGDILMRSLGLRPENLLSEREARKLSEGGPPADTAVRDHPVEDEDGNEVIGRDGGVESATSESEDEVPAAPAATTTTPAQDTTTSKRKRRTKRVTPARKKKKAVPVPDEREMPGDIHLTDISSVGFVGKTRKPSKPNA